MIILFLKWASEQQNQPEPIQATSKIQKFAKFQSLVNFKSGKKTIFAGRCLVFQIVSFGGNHEIINNLFFGNYLVPLRQFTPNPPPYSHRQHACMCVIYSYLFINLLIYLFIWMIFNHESIGSVRLLELLYILIFKI